MRQMEVLALRDEIVRIEEEIVRVEEERDQLLVRIEQLEKAAAPGCEDMQSTEGSES